MSRKVSLRQAQLLSDLLRLPTVLEVYIGSRGAWVYRCFGHVGSVQDEADGRSVLGLYRRGLLVPSPDEGPSAVWPERMQGRYSVRPVCDSCDTPWILVDTPAKAEA